MYWRGKLIGLFFGLLILKNPLGALLGLLVGHFFDKGLENALNRGATSQQVFLDSLFKVMGYIAKSDGRVSETELQIARDMMSRLQLTEAQRKAAMLAFTQGKQPGFNLETTIAELQNNSLNQHAKLKLFFTLQMQAAYGGSGYLNVSKIKVLQQVGALLGFAVPFMDFRYGSERAEWKQQYSGSQRPQPNPQFSLQDDYALLNVASSASDADVKKAWRRLMSQHHPDKLSAQGLSPAKLKQATEKTQQIKAAYDRIRAARGM